MFYGSHSGVIGLCRKEVFHSVDSFDPSITGYDKVFVDAGCTHDGSIKHIRKFEHWGWTTLQHRVLDAERTDSLSHLQLGLLINGFILLKVGGSLVYNTCSLTVTQDEDEVALRVKELNSPSFYPSMVSLWVMDSFERKDLERYIVKSLSKSACVPEVLCTCADQSYVGNGMTGGELVVTPPVGENGIFKALVGDDCFASRCCWLELSETNARRAFVEQSRFQEALILTEAYSLNQSSKWAPVLWKLILKPYLIEQFVAELVDVLPLQPSILVELAIFYRAEVAARGDLSHFSVWLSPGGLPTEWVKHLGRSFRSLLRRTRDLLVTSRIHKMLHHGNKFWMGFLEGSPLVSVTSKPNSFAPQNFEMTTFRV